MRLIIIAALIAAAPLALAVETSIGIGQFNIVLGRGCDADGECHPDEYAWVLATACMSAPGDATLEAERIAQASPVVLVPMHGRATGDARCPYEAVGRAEFWMDLFGSPIDCLRASVITTTGVVGTRAACP